MQNFEGDDEKAESNFQKHDVTFEEAATVFQDPFTVTISDPSHSLLEERFVDIGFSNRGRLLVVIYTERGLNTRIISSRLATKTEQKQYEQDDFI